MNPLERQGIISLTLHLACQMRAKNKEPHILWSRYWLQELVGMSTFSVLGMHECVNIQTSLEGRPVELKRPLFEVLDKTPKVRYVQMYVDSPHYHVTHRYCHLVSGLISLCDLQHHKTRAAMQRAADEYIMHVEDTTLKMVGQLSCRMEYVAVFDDASGIPGQLTPYDQGVW